MFLYVHVFSSLKEHDLSKVSADGSKCTPRQLSAEILDFPSSWCCGRECLAALPRLFQSSPVGPPGVEER